MDIRKIPMDIPRIYMTVEKLHDPALGMLPATHRFFRETARTGANP